MTLNIRHTEIRSEAFFYTTAIANANFEEFWNFNQKDSANKTTSESTFAFRQLKHKMEIKNLKGTASKKVFLNFLLFGEYLVSLPIMEVKRGKFHIKVGHTWNPLFGAYVHNVKISKSTKFPASLSNSFWDIATKSLDLCPSLSSSQRPSWKFAVVHFRSYFEFGSLSFYENWYFY